ncbi:MAG: DNA ligase D [Acidobacteria bacterium]|nr:DNA ligase D [Acidobacteriota bacterium]
MPLQQYRSKRNFKKTPEPRPGRVQASGRKLSYLIQKHDATRLHYDFRLELDGVLLSWAVTKGPSLNPADKRLAVRTEDHPLSYGSFEGTIPKGQYGGGTVMLWDEGSWEPKGDPQAGLKKGHLSFLLHGRRLKGGWGLIRMRGDGKRENWLLVKEKDDEARQDASNEEFLGELASSVKTGRSMEQIAGQKGPASKAKPGTTKKKAGRSPGTGGALKALMQRYPGVQLATLVEDPPAGDEWLHEIKFDGYRLLGFASGGAAALRTRNGNDWTGRFPALTPALEGLKVKDAVLDMEAVVVDEQGKSSFQALQEALGDGGQPEEIVAYVFDLLHLNGKDLTAAPLAERKKRLETLLNRSPQKSLLYSAHIDGEGPEVFAGICEKGLEGIISKRTNSIYVPGRQRSWLKIKCTLQQEFLILGFSEARTGSRALGALYLGYRKQGRLRYAGKVGTGFSMLSARTLRERLTALSVSKPTLSRAETAGLPAGEWKKVHWVTPSLLCEVAFTEWTQDGRIRHPSFLGLREDKEAREVKQELPAKSAAVAAPAKETTKSERLVLSRVTITHPDRVISAEGHVTKGEVAAYYEAVAPLILPQLTDRPLTLLRCPSGIGAECFFQRNPGKGLGPDVKPFAFKHKGKSYEYLYIEDLTGLLEVVQMGALELHPWGARVDAIDHPDRMIFDLDPDPELPFEAVKLAAQDLRQRLQQVGLESTLKCTGGKGLHVTVPLAGTETWPAVKSFAAGVAQQMVEAAPEAYVATMSKAKRKGKIFIDHFRNDYTATAIADYAVRARPGVPVALPLDWKELKRLESASQFTLQGVLKRVKGKRPSVPLTVKPQLLPK